MNMYSKKLLWKVSAQILPFCMIKKVRISIKAITRKYYVCRNIMLFIVCFSVIQANVPFQLDWSNIFRKACLDMAGAVTFIF